MDVEKEQNRIIGLVYSEIYHILFRIYLNEKLNTYNNEYLKIGEIGYYYNRLSFSFWSQIVLNHNLKLNRTESRFYTKWTSVFTLKEVFNEIALPSEKEIPSTFTRRFHPSEKGKFYFNVEDFPPL